MTMQLYSIKDRVAGEFGPVFEAKNDEVALRNFRNTMKETGFPEDYELYSLGSIDHDDGSIIRNNKATMIEDAFFNKEVGNE